MTTQQLPKVTAKVGQPVDNPFYVPDEYEIFKMKEKEKELKKQERLKIQNLKVHEKGVKAKGQFTISKINQLGEDEEIADKEVLAKMYYSNQNRNIVDAADSAVKNRVRQKEPMHQFIEKKREMLLFQMLIDHKRGMIDEFEKLTRFHRKGLQKSEQLLEEDLELFNKFLEANKNNSREAIKLAEIETRAKQEKVNELIAINDQHTNLKTKNSSEIGKLEEYWKYKKFLDGMTPKDFLDASKPKHKQKDTKKQQQESQPNDKGMMQYYNQNINDEIKLLMEESDEEFPMYFKSPQQLEEIFQSLEERNLFLIANTKEREQMVEELTSKFDQKKKYLLDKLTQASQQKSDVLKQIDAMNIQIQHLKNIKSESEAHESLAKLEIQISKIYKADINQEVRKDITGIEMLKEMEKKLDQQITTLRNASSQDPLFVINQEKECIKQKKEQQKKIKQEQDALEQLKKQQEQQKEPEVHKRSGRPVMVRSWPPQKEVEETQSEDMTEEQRDQLRYFT